MIAMTAAARPLPGPNSAADVLRGAADAYRTGTLTFGRSSFIDEGDPRVRCALGAITYAVHPADVDDGNPLEHGPVAAAAANTLADTLISAFGAAQCGDDDLVDAVETVGGWNDANSRTVGDVIAALDVAADRLDGAPVGGAA